MKFAFVMYKNLGEWLSPGVTGAQPVAAADNDDYDADDAHGDSDKADDGCLLEDNSEPSSRCRVVNSHVVSLATTSSLRQNVDLTEPVTLILSHIHVCLRVLISNCGHGYDLSLYHTANPF